MKLINKYKKKKVLKRSKTGMEAEFHLIDEKGRIADRADEIISGLKGVSENIQVVPEIGKSMVEFGCYPDVPTYNPALDIINSLERASELCHSNGLMLYPFASYPGKFEPLVRVMEKYRIKKKIFGIERVKTTCRVTGFHHHYTLPKGVFDMNKRMIKSLKKSKLKRSMVGSYNFEIAADPAITLITQSSPFYQGTSLGKDSRIIVYRGGKKLRYTEGVYSNLQQIGGLPPYKQTETDLINSLYRRWAKWEKLVRKVDQRANFNKMYPYKLDIGWNPVKINKHGTLEQRGMDINFMSVIVAVTFLLKFCLRKIQQEFIEVIPADFAIDEAFKLENGVLYVPPHTYIRNKIQYLSAYKGYDNKAVLNHVKRFFLFARSVTPKRYNKIIRPVYDMIGKKKSTSDKILSYARYKGYLSNGKINNTDAAELALYYAEQFPNDLELTKKNLEKVSSL